MDITAKIVPAAQTLINDNINIFNQNTIKKLWGLRIKLGGGGAHLLTGHFLASDLCEIS